MVTSGERLVTKVKVKSKSPERLLAFFFLFLVKTLPRIFPLGVDVLRVCTGRRRFPSKLFPREDETFVPSWLSKLQSLFCRISSGAA